MIASTEKAFCDKIIMTSEIIIRSTKQVREYLHTDLRLDEDWLRNLDASVKSSWIHMAPKKKNLQMLVITLQNL